MRKSFGKVGEGPQFQLHHPLWNGVVVVSKEMTHAKPHAQSFEAGSQDIVCFHVSHNHVPDTGAHRRVSFPSANSTQGFLRTE